MLYYAPEQALEEDRIEALISINEKRVLRCYAEFLLTSSPLCQCTCLAVELTQTVSPLSFLALNDRHTSTSR
jgi:hypothetical protein